MRSQSDEGPVAAAVDMPRTWYEARRFLEVDLAVNTEPLSRVTVRLLRAGQWLERDRRRRLAPLRKAWRAAFDLWSAFVGLELSPLAAVGPGLRLRHAGRGVVVHPHAVIGARAILFHNVTIGTRSPAHPGVAVVGDGVTLLTGCVLAGPVAVGDGAVVGANAVVVEDVPAGATVVPARSRVLPPRG